MVDTIRYEREPDVPVTLDADVIVACGGPGGLGAAVMAARGGAKTLLVERYGFLGGMAVSGEVHPFMSNHLDNEPMDAPVYEQRAERMWTCWPRMGKDLQIPKDAATLAAEDLCPEAGVQLVYHHQVADVQLDGDTMFSPFRRSGCGYARRIPTTDGTKNSSANTGWPRVFVLVLSHSKRSAANRNARMPLANRTTMEPQGLRTAVRPMAKPVNAFIACVAGRSWAILCTASGSILKGSINPANRIDGMKEICE